MQATATQTWNVTNTRTIAWYVHLFPSLTDLAFLLPAFLLFALLPGAHLLFSDGDTGWHIRTGDWILAHAAVPSVDLFSFSKPDQPWFAWEWGSDVLFALIHRVAGLAGVALATVLILGAVSATLFRLVRRYSDNDVLAFAVTVFATCGSMIHWLARPHVISWLFVLLFCHAIRSEEEGNPKPLYALPALMLLWTNLHGAFFVGIALLIVSALGALLSVVLEGTERAPRAYSQSKRYLLCAAASVAATFVNPYGWHLHKHVIEYLGDSKLLDKIQEFQSVNFHQGFSLFFEAMLLLAVAAAFWALRQGRYAAAINVVLWAHLALVSARNIPIFNLVAAAPVACLLSDALGRARTVRLLRKPAELVSEIVREFKPLERLERWYLLAAAGAFALAFCFASNQPGFDARFNPKYFPYSVMSTLRQAGIERLFTSDQWSDYLIYEFYPSRRVFMDGRSDFYGTDFVTTYQHIAGARYDWRQDLDRYGIDGVMLGADAPLATVLKESPRWKLLFDDGKVILFKRTLLSPGAFGTAFLGTNTRPKRVSTSTLQERRG
jgi:hypothetical protein